MPSGFQQDQNQLTPSYYRVIITSNNENAYWFAQADGDGVESEGRITPFAWDNFEGSDRPSTVLKAQALARGNLRFQSIIEAVENLADCQILDVETNAGPSGDSQMNNTETRFTIKFDRDEFVIPAYCAIRKQEDAGTDGSFTYDNVIYPRYWSYSGQEYSIANSADAVRDVIWKALAQGRDRLVRVFRPFDGSDPLVGEGVDEYITASKPFDNDQNAFNDIVVEEINGTTTTVTTD